MDFSNVDLALGTLTAYDSGSSVSSGFSNYETDKGDYIYGSDHLHHPGHGR